TRGVRVLPPWAMLGPDALLEAVPQGTGGNRSFLTNLEAEVRPSDLLIGICTSGSSAEPKIVLHTHGSVIRLTHVLRNALRVRANDITYTGMPFFWLGGLNYNLLQCMFEGSTMVLPPSPRPEDVIEAILRERVTRVSLWLAPQAALAEYARSRN